MVNKTVSSENMKYCKYCGEKIPAAAVICMHCGCQVEELKQNGQPNIIINNTNSNTSVTPVAVSIRAKNKWISFLLCFFLGYFGAHKFYEGKIGTGILYLFTCGLFCIGWLIDTIVLLFKPNPYYVH